ncbi:Ribonuclease H2 subunit C [Trichoplax sp. H2]|uniref:Uncharacterized protein n=1 Tax=Trichoplax adhaerens TaxID=10228 RepID=B3S0Q4_TRIAD|nr:hypothetical protein TRIADDRAFT_57135 [Trichoplax adhaerens]EDV23685.1 hypothetical protein TRIADDRAFT_57135 [Trichoplax adhaerens]RDD44889.1 Ribonuclease H2 subunit C [Trichoplax sp. H2]|eukprot:XP_002113211.1 hypothetical protein TRIADDRAFT_57135 [Trichoplax adhaerens]
MSGEIVIQDFSERKCAKLHLLPCTIDYNGQANIDSYFEPTIKKNGEDLSATYRGRPLCGAKMEVPDNYIGCVLKETQKPFGEDEDRRLKISSHFKELTYWNLDNRTSVNDKLQKAILWTKIATAIHKSEDT